MADQRLDVEDMLRVSQERNVSGSDSWYCLVFLNVDTELVSENLSLMSLMEGDADLADGCQPQPDLGVYLLRYRGR